MKEFRAADRCSPCFSKGTDGVNGLVRSPQGLRLDVVLGADHSFGQMCARVFELAPLVNLIFMLAGHIGCVH